jgi:8-oxo-dGTP pyrophosphatase MutT (NUDIX family)
MMASEIQNKGGVQKKQVRVGVGVLVKDPKRNGHIFAGIRQGSHGSGLLALPGGHLELMETWEDCAKREVEEETGLQVVDVNFLHVTNDPMPSENKRELQVKRGPPCSTKITCTFSHFLDQNHVLPTRRLHHHIHGSKM